MIRSLYLLLSTLLCGLLCPLESRADDLRWVMEPGDQRTFAMESGEQIKLSGKSVVEVERLQSGSYQVTAMRQGLAYIRILSTEGQLRRNWVIDVIKPLHKEKQEILHQEAWQSFFCDEAGIRCDAATSRISGQTASLPWFHRAKQECEKLSPCRFDVKMKSEARQQWSQSLAEEWPGIDWQVLEDGFVRAYRDCLNLQKTEVERIQSELRDRYGAPVLWQCKKADSERFHVEFLAITQRSDQSKLDNPVQWKLSLLPQNAPIEATLEGLSQDGSLRIVAKPRILAGVGSEIQIRDGGELRVNSQGRDGVEVQWKPVGFQLATKILGQKENMLQIRCELRLSRSSPHSSQLASSELQTTTWMERNQWTQIGTVQTESDDRQTSLIPWLGELPLLGRLFSWRNLDRQRSDLTLFVRIVEADSPVPLDPLNPEMEGPQSSPDS